MGTGTELSSSNSRRRDQHAGRENPRVSSQATTPANEVYRSDAPFLDELFEPDGAPRPVARPLVEVLNRLGSEGLIDAGRRRDAIFMQQGITFETSGEGETSHERPFRWTSCRGC